MKKWIFSLTIIAAAFMVGCSKKDKGSTPNPNNYRTYGYGYGSCYGNGYVNNYGGYTYGSGYGYGGGYGGGYSGNYRYQYINGVCRDTYNNTTAPEANCRNATGAVPGANNPSCNYYGGYNQFYGSNPGICAQFDRPELGLYTYPVYFPGTNQTLCVEYSTIQYIGSYGTPMIPPTYAGYGYGGYGYAAVGCVPGVNVPANCHCATLGGQLGWFSAGISAGICF